MALRKMFALSLALYLRLETARKWPITPRYIQPIANGHFFGGKLFIYLFISRLHSSIRCDFFTKLTPTMVEADKMYGGPLFSYLK